MVSVVRRHVGLFLAISIALAVLSIATAMVPDWIELLFGAEPDAGTGEAEWSIVAALAIGAALSGLAALIVGRVYSRG